MPYLWVKAFHLIAVISWMAGIFYLPRLFVYHTKIKAKSAEDKLFQTMERKLLRYIMNPAMILTYIFGIWMLLLEPHFLKQGWMHIKIFLILLMTFYHHLLARQRKAFEKNRNIHSERYYRIINEVPTFLMIAIVILVIVKPF